MEEEAIWLLHGDAEDLLTLGLGSSTSSHRQGLYYRREQPVFGPARPPSAIWEGHYHPTDLHIPEIPHRPGYYDLALKRPEATRDKCPPSRRNLECDQQCSHSAGWWWARPSLPVKQRSTLVSQETISLDLFRRCNVELGCAVSEPVSSSEKRDIPHLVVARIPFFTMVKYSVYKVFALTTQKWWLLVILINYSHHPSEFSLLSHF